MSDTTPTPRKPTVPAPAPGSDAATLHGSATPDPNQPTAGSTVQGNPLYNPTADSSN